MSFISYLPEPFKTTHENKFFRELSQALEREYQSKEGLHVLIGNISVQGNAIDALFIKRGAIIVIDFKNYEGSLKFSENGPWVLTNKDNKQIFVAGGAVSRNPYLQVNTYRFALMEFLNLYEKEILDPNHISVNWGHINTMVLFHRPIQYDPNEIPEKIKLHFHIVDVSNYINCLNEAYSSKLNLSDNEISNIVVKLNLDTNDIFNSEREILEAAIPVKRDIKVEQFARLEKLLSETLKNSHSERVLSFFNTMISIERMKEVRLTEYFVYDLNLKSVNLDKFTFDLSNYSEIYNVFLKTKVDRNPKNLFIALSGDVLGNVIPLFYLSLKPSEITNEKAISVSFNSFELFTAEILKLNLPEELIEEIETKINDSNKLEEKIKHLETYLDYEINLNDNIVFALSDESLYTAQLQSEIRSILNKKVPFPSNDSLFSGFIYQEPLSSFPEIKINRYVQLTDLNTAQFRAVMSAMEKPITIITGPPGTGKSQVVLNILANAIVNGQKVLFASRNNKAVDNVHIRFNEKLDTEYFIRFGSKKENEKIADSLKQFLSSKDLNDLSIQYSESEKEISSLNNTFFDLRKKLYDIAQLENELNSLQLDKNTLQNELQVFINNLDLYTKEWFVDKELTLPVSNSEINEVLHPIKNVNGFISKIIFNLFKKTKVIQLVKDLNKQLPPEISNYLDQNYPIFSSDISLVESLKKNVLEIRHIKNREEAVKDEYRELKHRFENVNNLYNELNRKYQSEVQNRETYWAEIHRIRKELTNVSPRFIKLLIDLNIEECDDNIIHRYASYLKNGFPWKHEELNFAIQFVNEFLQFFNNVSCSNLTVKSSFPLAQDTFDLLVIDEASQCDMVSMLPMLYRAKRICILGDPLQLKHITSVRRDEQDYVLDHLDLDVSQFDYVGDSLYDVMEKYAALNNIKPIFLNEHFRCHPDIIGFSKKYFYQKMSGQDLDIKTNAAQFKYGDVGFNWHHVAGEVDQNKNFNYAEVDKCIELLRELIVKYPEASIGVITPFRHQKELLRERIYKYFKSGNVVVDTVNGFQGDEKDIIVFSMVLSTNARASMCSFINFSSFYLLNVAITRARSSLYIVGNKDYCKNLKDRFDRPTLVSRLASYEEEIKKMINN